MLDSKEMRKRLGLNKLLGFRVAVFALFGILVLQLTCLQIVRGSSYEERAEQNSIAILELPAERGIITDRSGVPLVANIPAYDLVAVPGRIRDAERREIILTLAEIVQLPESRLARLIEEAEEEAAFQPTVLKEGLTREEALTIAEIVPDMQGISLQVAASRHYTSGELLAPVVGYIGPIDETEYEESQDSDDPYGLGDRIGRTGIERVYEQYLRGHDGRKLIEQDALGRQLRLLREQDPVPGHKVVLAMDYALQTATERALRQSMEDYDAAIGAAVVMDVRTGEVLSLVSLPSYDANMFAEGVTERTFEELNADTEGRPLVNHVISDQFPPGSIFKVITGTAALEYGSATRNTRIASQGFLEVEPEFGGGEESTQRFRDTRVGTFDFVQGLAASSNVYFYCLVAAGQPGSQFFRPGCGPDEFEGVGPGILSFWGDLFGLGKTTGIDLPGEVGGSIPPWGEAGDLNDPDDDTGDEAHDGADEGDPARGMTNLSAWFARRYFDNGGSPGEPWHLGNTLQYAIGQNVVTTTPLQMAVVTAAIANGGTLLEPRLVHDVVDFEGASLDAIEVNGDVMRPGEPVVRGQLPVHGETLATLREGMLLATTADYGTATPASIGIVQVAGKTGSPEVDETDTGTGKPVTHAWFIGFAPYDNPEIAVAVYVQGGTGAEAAAPVARAIFEAYFSRVNVMGLLP